MQDDLDSIVYANRLQHERIVNWGMSSICQLYSGSKEGERLIKSLTDFWIARRMPGSEHTRDEHWRLEIVADQITLEEFKSAAMVYLISDMSNERRGFKVLQIAPRRMPGKVYQLKMAAIDQRVTSSR